MKKLLVICLLTAHGCGADNANKGSAIQPDNAAPSTSLSDKGGNRVEIAANETSSMYIADETKLPDCSLEHEGFLVFQADTKEFKACLSESWTVVDVKGQQGDKGDKGDKGDIGEQGDKGIAGAAGISAVVVKTTVSLRARYYVGVVSAVTRGVYAKPMPEITTTEAKTFTLSSEDFASSITNGLSCAISTISDGIYDCSYLAAQENCEIKESVLDDPLCPKMSSPYQCRICRTVTVDHAGQHLQ